MKHLTPTDAVPSLRGDLVFTPRPNGSGAEVVQIRPIGSNDRASLHGFELSLARMLDGHRNAQDLLNHAARIGLPLNLSGLEGFIDFLSERSLIARTAGEEATPVSPWAERTEWDPIVRLQYQAALKALRAGQPEDARVLLDHLLESAPLLDEARALRGWLAQHPRGVLDGESFNETFQKAQRSWLSRRATVARFPELARSEPLDAAELRAVRPSFAPIAALIAVGVIIVASLIIPIPARVSLPAQLAPVMVSPIVAPEGGVIGQVRVHEGQEVKAGDVLLTFAGQQVITAPQDGVVHELIAVEGKPVLEAQELMRLEDTHELRMTARLDSQQAREVRPGQTATIALGQRSAKSTVSAVRGREVVSMVNNAGDALEPGHAIVDIDVGPRSLLQRIR
jgi:hypothetical protein